MRCPYCNRHPEYCACPARTAHMRPGNEPRTTTGITRSPDELVTEETLTVVGDPLDQAPAEWLARAKADLPEGATLIGVSQFGFRYARGGHEYDRTWV